MLERKKVKAKPFSSSVGTHLQGQRFAFETMTEWYAGITLNFELTLELNWMLWWYYKNNPRKTNIQT